MSILYIFVTTNRPDQYLNSIVDQVEKGTRKIVFTQIEDERIETVEKVKLNLLQANVYSLLQNLSTGVYKYYTGSLKDQEVQLEAKYSNNDLAKLKARYSLCLKDDINWQVESVKYLNLRNYISNIAKKQCIIDVTSVSKVYLTDIISCSLLENIDNICVFDLYIKPNFDEPWKILIHELEENKTYRYKNLLETPIFKDSRKSILIRRPPLFFSLIITFLCIVITLIGTSLFGFNSMFVKTLSTIGTVLGIISFFLIYFPVRGK